MALLKRKAPACQTCGQLWPGRNCRTCARDRALVAGRPIPQKARCHDCGVRYAQERGICRQCSRARGDSRTLRERRPPADPWARHRSMIEALERVVYVPKVAREVVVAGVAYDVVWDGAIAAVEPDR